jgi:hypothetical protein
MVTEADVLSKVREILATAKRGLDDLTGRDPTRKTSGLHNVAVFGRSVTLVLQNLRSVNRSAFDAWYEPRVQTMAKEPLFTYFRELRNTILKQGPPNPSNRVYIGSFNTDDLKKIPAPPGASAFFIGDQLGGSGWEVELPDGSVEKFYIELPGHMGVKASWHLPDPPSEFEGKPITDTSIENLSRLYVGALTKLVQDAESEFGQRPKLRLVPPPEP